jgi:hypothetical protein
VQSLAASHILVSSFQNVLERFNISLISMGGPSEEEFYERTTKDNVFWSEIDSEFSP